MYRFQSRDSSAITMPVLAFSIPSLENETLLLQYFNRSETFQGITLDIVDTRVNPWKYWAESVGFQVYNWVVIVVIFLAGLLALARLAGFVMYFGVQFSMPQICLALDLIGNICMSTVTYDVDT